jgi:hypothetical protein
MLHGPICVRAFARTCQGMRASIVTRHHDGVTVPVRAVLSLVLLYGQVTHSPFVILIKAGLNRADPLCTSAHRAPLSTPESTLFGPARPVSALWAAGARVSAVPSGSSPSCGCPAVQHWCGAMHQSEDFPCLATSE